MSNLFDEKDLIFIDETGTNTSMSRSYGRSKKGEKANSIKPSSKGKNVTLIGAMSMNGIIASMTLEGGTKSEVFLTFARELLVPVLSPSSIVIMDNLAAHKTLETRNIIESTGAKIIYLPRYSPDLNPIELCWSKIKSFIRAKSPRTIEHLQQSISQAIQFITPDFAKSFISHCGYLR